MQGLPYVGLMVSCSFPCPYVQIANLEEQLRASSLPLKKCQTRLEGRTERVCHDLVRDAPQESLVAEVQHLTQTRTLLREKLAQALYVSCLACLYSLICLLCSLFNGQVSHKALKKPGLETQPSRPHFRCLASIFFIPYLLN